MLLLQKKKKVKHAKEVKLHLKTVACSSTYIQRFESLPTAFFYTIHLLNVTTARRPVLSCVFGISACLAGM